MQGSITRIYNSYCKSRGYGEVAEKRYNEILRLEEVKPIDLINFFFTLYSFQYEIGSIIYRAKITHKERSIAKSIAGSLIFIPPAIDTKTSKSLILKHIFFSKTAKRRDNLF